MNSTTRKPWLSRVHAGRYEVWMGDDFLGYVSNPWRPGERFPGRGLAEWGYLTVSTFQRPGIKHCLAGFKTRADAIAGLVAAAGRAALTEEQT